MNLHEEFFQFQKEIKEKEDFLLSRILKESLNLSETAHFLYMEKKKGIPLSFLEKQTNLSYAEIKRSLKGTQKKLDQWFADYKEKEILFKKVIQKQEKRK